MQQQLMQGQVGAGYAQGGPAPAPVMGKDQAMSALHAGLAAKKLVIKQKVSLLEGAADAIGCCESCFEQPNQYDIFDAYTGAPVLQANEESGFFCRCCCQPNHELQLKLRVPQTQQIVGTIDRPFKCAGPCPALLGFCQSEATLFAGTDVGNAASQIGSAKQPCFGGCFTPTVNVALGTNEATETPFAIAEGPTCCFGGMTEMCCDQEFFVSSAPGKEGDLAKIVKEKPEGGQIAAELLTDADLFTLTINNDSLGPDQRLALISSVLLMDYMFFESGGAFECNPFDQSCTITCCNLYCCGAIQPVKCKCGGGSDDN